MPVSAIRNKLRDDPLLDWLERWGVSQGWVPDPEPSSETDFARFLAEKGIGFERGVMALIEGKLRQGGERLVRVAESGADALNPEKREETLRWMREGVAAIDQGVLWDPVCQVYGIPDLLIRSDRLNAVFCDALTLEEASRPAPHLGVGAWHYVAVDVKYTTLCLDARSEISNDRSSPIYKAQLALYNAALGEMQGYTPPSAFLLGRGWRKSKERGVSCLERIGRFRIDQPQHGGGRIDWLARAEEACAWVRRVQKEGALWRVLPEPSVRELRPNLANAERQGVWRGPIKRLAAEIGEPTALWQVGFGARREMEEQGMPLDWRTPEGREAVLTVLERRKGTAYATRLRHLFRAQEASVTAIPERIETRREEWHTPEALEFFVDFETCSDLDDDWTKLPEKGGQALIFMIGCGHYEAGEWVFHCFVAEAMTPQAEGEILEAWRRHCEEVRARLAPDLASPKVFHWSPAEDSSLGTAYNSARSRHGDPLWEPNWFDFLNRVVKPSQSDACVAFHGAMGFGLKAVGKALRARGAIETAWEDGPTDGLGAMTGAWWCYREAARLGVSVREVRTASDGRALMREIEGYNEVDCRVMAETIQYLRRCH